MKAFSERGVAMERESMPKSLEDIADMVVVVVVV